MEPLPGVGPLTVYWRALARWVLVAFVVLACPSPGGATWSIVAVDPATREVGIAAASCFDHVDRIAGVVPGRGAVAAQAMANLAARDRAAALLEAGAGPWEVVARITTEEFDPGLPFSWRRGGETRQYGVVALGYESLPAAFTGTRTIAWSGSRQGSGVSVQGNLLRGAEVVDAAYRAYRKARRCSLADRLVLALEAGAAAGGDRRCSRSLSALSAFVEVAGPTDRAGDSSLRIVVPYDGKSSDSAWTLFRQMLFPEDGPAERNPVRVLRSEYLSWRRGRSGEEICPALTGDPMVGQE